MSTICAMMRTHSSPRDILTSKTQPPTLPVWARRCFCRTLGLAQPRPQKLQTQRPGFCVWYCCFLFRPIPTLAAMAARELLELLSMLPAAPADRRTCHVQVWLISRFFVCQFHCGQTKFLQSQSNKFMGEMKTSLSEVVFYWIFIQCRMNVVAEKSAVVHF